MKRLCVLPLALLLAGCGSGIGERPTFGEEAARTVRDRCWAADDLMFLALAGLAQDTWEVGLTHTAARECDRREWSAPICDCWQAVVDWTYFVRH